MAGLDYVICNYFVLLFWTILSSVRRLPHKQITLSHWTEWNAAVLNEAAIARSNKICGIELLYARRFKRFFFFEPLK